MAPVATGDLSDEIADACEKSEIVETYAVLYMDMDILKVRVHLTDGRFIQVFYNLATEKASLALIENQKRIYGKDNAKMGWHVHPWDAPEAHFSCDPVTFTEFLDEVTQMAY